MCISDFTDFWGRREGGVCGNGRLARSFDNVYGSGV